MLMYPYVIKGPFSDARPVEESRLGAFQAVCQIETANGRRGMGCFTQEGAVITAAHNLQGAKVCKVKFALESRSIDSAHIFMFPGSERSDRSVKECSSVDFACIILDSDPGFLGLALVEATPVTLVQSVYFRNGRLYYSDGPAACVESFIGHNADTSSGDSGCPILSDGAVVAVHLGSSGVSQAFLLNNQSTFNGLINSALALTHDKLEFIRASVDGRRNAK